VAAGDAAGAGAAGAGGGAAGGGAAAVAIGGGGAGAGAGAAACLQYANMWGIAHRLLSTIRASNTWCLAASDSTCHCVCKSVGKQGAECVAVEKAQFAPLCAQKFPRETFPTVR